MSFYILKDVHQSWSFVVRLFDMKYIDGRIFKIRNEEVNSVLLIHFKKVIPNLGMERAGNKGDLVLEFAINNLEQLSSEQIGKLKEIL